MTIDTVAEAVGDLSTQHTEPRSAYIHVPFCVHRCGYCDFPLVAGRDDLIGDYLQALQVELQSLEAPCEVDTLFFGGGTPTHLSAEQLARLMEIVLERIRPADGCEFSVEANPAGLTDEKIAVLAGAGVNRVSLGVQSFDSQALRILERDHGPDDVARVVDRLRRHGCDNISFDLIFAVPGQTLESWRETLRRAVELAPQHVSTYGLTFEKGTPFWSRLQKGQLRQADEELERSMYAAAMDELTAAGFAQYEISSFARPGFRCRHNLVYWQGRPYSGFGPGAARYVDGRREANHRSVLTWLKRIEAGQSPVAESESLSPEERSREVLVFGLRMTDGIDKRAFRQRTGFDVHQVADGAIDRFLQSDLLEETETHLRLTREGRFLADTVCADLV